MDVVYEVQHVVGVVGASRVEGLASARPAGVPPEGGVAVGMEGIALHVAVQ